MNVVHHKINENDWIAKNQIGTATEKTQKDKMSAQVPPNLFTPVDPSPAEELVTALLERPGVRIERIVSAGQASPPGFWYDQDGDEWVLLLAGAARLEIENGGVSELAPGDHLLLPAHCRHRVDWTDPARQTVWLAIHIGLAAASSA